MFFFFSLEWSHHHQDQPGHRRPPSSPLRNQLTMNTAGRFFKLLWQWWWWWWWWWSQYGGQGGDGVEIDELNGDHEQTGHDVKNNQWWRCWWGSWWHQLLIKVLKEWQCWPQWWKLVWWRWPAELDPMLQIVAKVVAKERPHWEGIVHDLEKMVIKM